MCDMEVNVAVPSLGLFCSGSKFNFLLHVHVQAINMFYYILHHLLILLERVIMDNHIQNNFVPHFIGILKFFYYILEF